MAKRYRLVPDSGVEGAENSFAEKAMNFSTLVELLPKNLRNKARILVHYLENKITLNEHQRIVYENGEVGSYLLDMIRYYVSPLVKQRPVDAPDFESVLKNLGVPSSALARNIETNILDKWLEY